MNAGLILLGWLCAGIATVLALMASGIFSIQIEINHDEKKKDPEDEDDD